MSVTIHNPAPAPEIIAGGLSGVPEYDVPMMLRWLKADGVCYWIEECDIGQRQGEYIVRDGRDGAEVGSFFTLAAIRRWAE